MKLLFDRTFMSPTTTYRILPTCIRHLFWKLDPVVFITQLLSLSNRSCTSEATKTTTLHCYRMICPFIEGFRVAYLTWPSDQTLANFCPCRLYLGGKVLSKAVMFTNAIRMFVEVILVPTEALVSGLEPLSCKYNMVDTTDNFVIHETKCSKKRRTQRGNSTIFLPLWNFAIMSFCLHMHFKSFIWRGIFETLILVKKSISRKNLVLENFLHFHTVKRYITKV